MKKTENYAMPYPEQDDYFNVEDFQNMMVSVDNLMKKLSDSGAQISSDAEHLYNQTKAQMDNIQKRMNTFTSLKDGSTTGDAELEDIRVAYDGKEYGNAGEAVREQASDIHKALFGAGASIWSKAKSESTKYVAETKGICILNERFTAAGVVTKISRGTFAENESTLNLDRECSAYIVEFEKNPGTVYMPSAETIKIVSTTKIIFEANGNARCWIPVEKGQYLAVDSTATAYTSESNHVPYMLYDQANKTLECRGFGSAGSIEPVDPYSLALEYKLEYDMDDTGLVKQIEQSKTDVALLKEETGRLKEDLNKLNDGGLVLKDEIIKEDINNWLDEHPEATTTVQDDSIGTEKFTETLRSEFEDLKNRQPFQYETDNVANTKIEKIRFLKKFSTNFFRKFTYKLGEMSLSRDFVSAINANQYPLTTKNNKLTETVTDGTYSIANNTEKNEQLNRQVLAIYPFCTYKLIFDSRRKSYGARVGMSFAFSGTVLINIFAEKNDDGTIIMKHEAFVGGISRGIIDVGTFSENEKLSSEIYVSYTLDGFECYYNANGNIRFLGYINTSELEIPQNLTLLNGNVLFFARLGPGEKVDIECFECYYDTAISQSDVRPILYTDSQPYIENGKIFYTCTTRTQKKQYQIVISQKLGGCDFELEGVIFYVVDNKICNDIAASVKYDPQTCSWLIWNTHNGSGYHELSYGISPGKILYGVNFVQMKIMNHELTDTNGYPSISDDTLFCAKYGDEDPDFIKIDNKWYMVICRISDFDGNKNYKYYVFESENPFSDYVYKGKIADNAVTGGSFVKIGERYYVICGYGYGDSMYKAYSLEDLTQSYNLTMNYTTGGYRGWGSVYALQCGSFTRLCWITFDRENATEANWGYGNLYYYESDTMDFGTNFNKILIH